MLSHIIRHEVRDVWRDGRFRWSAAFVGALLIVALVTGWTYQRAVAAEHGSAGLLMRETWLTQPPKDPHTAAHYGSYAFKPHGPLTLFDSGVNPYSGIASFLEAHKQNEFQFRPAQDRASIARLGQLTAAGTLQFVVPVLIILLAFTKFAGEREDGTLRQLVASGVSVCRLTIGKALGVSAALMMVLVPAAVVGAVALVLASGSMGMSQSAMRIAALVVVYAIYFMVFIAAGLTISARVRRSSVALAALLAFWVFNAVIVPRAASDVSRRLYPTPTAFAFADSIQRDTYDGVPVHAYNVKRAADLRERLFDTYKVSRVEDLPVNFRGIDYLEREAHANDLWDKHFTALWTTFDRQTGVHHLAGWLAPLMSVRSLSMALSGVDTFHHRDFAVEAEAYRRRLVLAMNSDLAYAAGSQKRGSYTAAPALWSTIRPFEYRQPGLAWALGNVRNGVLALCAWAVAACAALMLLVRRTPVD